LVADLLPSAEPAGTSTQTGPVASIEIDALSGVLHEPSW
jgi:hypothetical protein